VWALAPTDTPESQILTNSPSRIARTGKVVSLDVV
jgi:hypothetical protein